MGRKTPLVRLKIVPVRGSQDIRLLPPLAPPRPLRKPNDACASALGLDLEENDIIRTIKTKSHQDQSFGLTALQVAACDT